MGGRDRWKTLSIFSFRGPSRLLGLFRTWRWGWAEEVPVIPGACAAHRPSRAERSKKVPLHPHSLPGEPLFKPLFNPFCSSGRDARSCSVSTQPYGCMVRCLTSLEATPLFTTLIRIGRGRPPPHHVTNGLGTFGSRCLGKQKEGWWNNKGKGGRQWRGR